MPITTAHDHGPAAPQHQAAEVPEGFWYSVKRRVLGPPLVTEHMSCCDSAGATASTGPLLVGLAGTELKE
jgi:hypothetical protein